MRFQYVEENRAYKAYFASMEDAWQLMDWLEDMAECFDADLPVQDRWLADDFASSQRLLEDRPPETDNDYGEASLEVELNPSELVRLAHALYSPVRGRATGTTTTYRAGDRESGGRGVHPRHLVAYAKSRLRKAMESCYLNVLQTGEPYEG